MKTITTLAFCAAGALLFAKEAITTLRVYVPRSSDEVYIVGNQPNLGDWAPDKVKMGKVSDFEREITLRLRFPAEFKFTRGSWDSEAITNSLSERPNIHLDSPPIGKVTYKVQGWLDRIEAFSTYSQFEIKRIASNALQEARKIYISLPEHYSNDRRYPVVYITDAQNLSNFEMALQTLRQQANFHLLPECILVGIFQSDRNGDFKLAPEPQHNAFQDFLTKELTTYIEENYSTSGFKVLIGHSNGAEYNHTLMFQADSPFDAYVNISEELHKTFPYMAASWNERSEEAYSNFFSTYGGKPLRLFVASGSYDFWHRRYAGKTIDSLYRASPNKNIAFKHALYPAEHNSLVACSMLDALRFVFEDFKDFDAFKQALLKHKNYGQAFADFERKTKDLGSYSLSDEDKDILETIVFDTKDRAIFNQWNEIANSDGRYTPAAIAVTLIEVDPEGASEKFDALINAKDKEILRYLAPMIHNEAHTLGNPRACLKKIESLLKYCPEQKLPLSYFQAKTAIESGIDLKNGKAALAYCTSHFEDNKYFTQQDLNILKSKL
jgi:predicted alpha/beta superfamily hydrolase